jgi:hypothetical protein
VRRSVCALLLLATVGLVAGCGGSKPKALGPEQRVLKEGELAGYTCYPDAPKGIPRPPCARYDPSVVKDLGSAFINDPRGAQKRLGPYQRKIVQAVGESLERAKGTGNATSLAVRFKSSNEAKTFLEKLFPESFAPCPKKCQVVKTEFHVSGIHGADGAKLALTVGPARDRFQAYRIEFADGPFVYGLAAYAPLGKLSEDTVVAAAKTLYKRVKGHPAPGT